MSPSKSKPAPPADADSEAPTPEATTAPSPPESPPSPPAPPAQEPPDWERSYRYLLADFENFRRRVDRERDQAVRAAQGRLLLRFIDLHEGIQQVAESLPKEAGPIREGLELLLKNLDTLLRQEGVEPVAKVGEGFRTENHEALGTVPAPKEILPGSVAVIVQQGFRGPGGVLRPAKVLLAATPPPEGPATEAPSTSDAPE